MPPEGLSERSGLPVNVCADSDNLYDAVAEIMIETILAKEGRKVTMRFPGSLLKLTKCVLEVVRMPILVERGSRPAVPV